LLALNQDKIKHERQLHPKLRVEFKWLINHSDNVLGRAETDLCHNIRMMRNCYIHYENTVAHLAWMQEVGMVKKRNELQAQFGNDPKALKFIDSFSKLMDDLYKQEGMLPIRFEHLENEEVMPFIENRYKQYMNWIIHTWSSRKQRPNKKEFVNIYDIEAFDDLACINCIFAVVKKLNFI
jgi:hypothetical protein